MGEPSPNIAEVQRTLGKYALIEKLGEGHLGPVFRGFDQDQGKPVVVRILPESIRWNARLETFFFQACETIVRLEHPNIVSVYDVGKEGYSPYIVMESLGTGNLEALLKKKPDMPVEDKLSIMIQAAEGLSYAHKKTIVHRDLQPGKIHLTTDGGVKIRDFAVAHILTRHLPRRITHWRKPIYLSPEQIQKMDTDERSDIFSIGAIFYELLTYSHPFQDSQTGGNPDKDLLDDPIPTFDQFPDVPPGFWPILKTCMAADPEDRYRSMEELLNACKDLRKSLAEDTQLMLAELYASQNALEKAASQPDASESTIGLLQKIRKLSRGDTKPDCVTLDRMTTDLIGQYSIIQSAAEAPDVAVPHPAFEIPEPETAGRDESPAESAPKEEPEGLEADTQPIEESPADPQPSSPATVIEPDSDSSPDTPSTKDADARMDSGRRNPGQIHSFDLDHKHGLFGGSCRGVLLISGTNIEYNPYSGQHGFRVPFRLLKISRIDRKSVELSFASDNKNFESFKFLDDVSAMRFNQVWTDLESIPQ